MNEKQSRYYTFSLIYFFYESLSFYWENGDGSNAIINLIKKAYSFPFSLEDPERDVF